MTVGRVSLEHRRQTAFWIWECAYAFAHCRHWDARGFESMWHSEVFVTDIEIQFDRPSRETLPGSSHPILAAGFYARAFYSTAALALQHLRQHPDSFTDVATLSKAAHKNHPIKLVRDKIVQHPSFVVQGQVVEAIGVSHSLRDGVRLAWDDGPPDDGLVANATALVRSFDVV